MKNEKAQHNVVRVSEEMYQLLEDHAQLRGGTVAEHLDKAVLAYVRGEVNPVINTTTPQSIRFV